MKQRWVKFEAWGGEVVKGSKPEGNVIEAPSKLPFHIPMHYWKNENGAIVEMNAEEKALSDKECAAPMKAPPRPKIVRPPNIVVQKTEVLCNHECPPPIHEVHREEVHVDLSALDEELSSLESRIARIEEKPEPQPRVIQDIFHNHHPVKKLTQLDWMRVAGVALAVHLLLKLIGI